MLVQEEMEVQVQEQEASLPQERQYGFGGGMAFVKNIVVIDDDISQSELF
ncbi:hypothetical protein AAHB56_02345 [Bacillus thuringiensis]